MGDVNIDLLKSESCDFAKNITEQLFTSSFYPLITKPTRITSHSATPIDNIFTNKIDKIDTSINGILVSDIYDNLPIFHKRGLNIQKPHRKTTEKFCTERTYNKNSIRHFTDEIKKVSWEDIISLNNPDGNFTKFSALFADTYNRSFPIKTIKTKTNIDKGKSPWMTKCIMKSIKNKISLYRKYLLVPNKVNEKLYKKYKNKLNHVIRLSKKSITKTN